MYPDAYDKDKKPQGGRWCQAVHGSHLAALYSILASGTITTHEVYCHGLDPLSGKRQEDLRHKANFYLTYWSPLDDGRYYAVKVDVDVDRDRGWTSGVDQWVQPGDSTRITGIWIHAVK
jgi:hypothetical protein